MAKKKRVNARRTRVRAKPQTKSHAKSQTKIHAKSQARPHGNRLVFAPELLADGKRRYETTPESLDSIALDFSNNRSTLKNVARREGWVRYVPPPVGLSRAAGIAAEAEALEAEALNDRHPEVRAAFAASLEGWTAADSGAVALRGAQERPPQGDGNNATERAPQGDREDAGGGESPAAAWSLRERIDELRASVDEEIAAVRALRAKLKTVPHSTETAGKTSRTLADLTATLERLQRIEIGASQHHGQHSHDDRFSDLLADPDAMRLDLARRIAAFMESRPDDADAGGDAAGADGVAGG